MMQEKVIPKVEGVIPPDPVSFWPPQPGWYVVIAILLVLIFWFSYKLVKKYKYSAYRRSAIDQLKQYALLNPAEPEFINLNRLLKAVAIKTYGRSEVASLSGEHWSEFLNKKVKGDLFTDEQLNFLTYSSFNPKSFEPMEQQFWTSLLSNCQKWVKDHR